MKRTITLLLPVLVLITSLALVSSCKDESEPTPTNNNNTTKTLTKAQLYDKEWHNEIGHTHNFLSDGTYKASPGTWRWINDSDTMEIIDLLGKKLNWVFEWSAEHEMSCKLTGNEKFSLYKDEPW